MTRLLSPVLPERFWDKVIPEPNSGCWLWTGAINGGGYGNVWWKGKYKGAHRVAWVVLVGPVPDDLQLDHLCRVRCCVNPDHLEPVTCRDNLLRGEGPSAVNASKTTCPRGHAYEPGNTRIRSTGARVCRQCDIERKSPAYHSSGLIRDSNHCKQGHELTPENTGRNGPAKRYCRICSRARYHRDKDAICEYRRAIYARTS